VTIEHSRSEALARLDAALQELPFAVVAVSGGIDSLTLMASAHRKLPGRARAIHAISDAVPVDATRRARSIASGQGWAYEEIDAGELKDENYLANPLNRCLYCKRRLYSALEIIAAHYHGVILSGANVDDLGDYRPGLVAASEHKVRHPFIEAGLSKADVRAAAPRVGLAAYADLPASPCLSSRIETGLGIDGDVLRAVDRIEVHLREALGEGVVRCRIRAEVCEIELGEGGLQKARSQGATLIAEIERRLAAAGIATPVIVSPYRTGSAFLREPRG
jgi:pyridinium-3,5-biscarboxylic acid mononucleotide sulfurtransferase